MQYLVNNLKKYESTNETVKYHLCNGLRSICIPYTVYRGSTVASHRKVHVILKIYFPVKNFLIVCNPSQVQIYYICRNPVVIL